MSFTHSTHPGTKRSFSNQGVDAGFLEYAKHLRLDHGISRRKVALRLHVTEKWVKDNVEDHDV